MRSPGLRRLGVKAICEQTTFESEKSTDECGSSDHSAEIHGFGKEQPMMIRAFLLHCLPGFIFLLALDPASAEIVANYDVEEYRIDGYNVSTLRESMRKKRKHAYNAYTKWDITWNWKFSQGNGGFKMHSFVANLKIKYTIPKWRERQRADPALQKEWNRYIEATKLHEKGHADIGKACVAEIDRTVTSKRWTGSNQPEISERLNKHCQAILKKYIDREVAYDKKTNHGFTQGARLGIAKGAVKVTKTTNTSIQTSTAPPPGWKLIWSDEFTKFDESKWSKGYKWGKTHNHGAYMDDSLAFVSNGKLHLRAKHGRPSVAPKSVKHRGENYSIEYSSGAINSAGKFRISDCFVQARIKTSGVQGTWPAFWMLSDTRGLLPEINIMENPITSPDTAHTWHHNFHYGKNWENEKSFGGKRSHRQNLASGFHVYGMAWSSNYIEFYFDGKRVERYNRKEPDSANHMYIILNLAVGGLGGEPANPFPVTSMEVDWVRVFRWGGK